MVTTIVVAVHLLPPFAFIFFLLWGPPFYVEGKKYMVAWQVRFELYHGRAGKKIMHAKVGEGNESLFMAAQYDKQAQKRTRNIPNCSHKYYNIMLKGYLYASICSCMLLWQFWSF